MGVCLGDCGRETGADGQSALVDAYLWWTEEQIGVG